MKRNQMTKATTITAASKPFTRKKIVTALLALQPMIVMLYGPPAHAQLTPDANAAQQPGIAAAANGVPVLNITGPNAAGVSHNVFTDYNVGKAGLIVNNSNAAVDTQLGGRIDGNSQLGATPAQVILNEVTGSAPSLLNGSTEIAGQAAHLIVANPNGITANGAGFINASRVTLSTGKPVFDSDGNVAALDVKQGRILVEGEGLDARGSDRLDLVTRSLKLNAALHAKQLNVVAGAGHYDATTDSNSRPDVVTAQDDAPAVAIDVAQLGGMYANSINLVGKEAGVGVNVAGKLQSLTGDITLSSGGDVVLEKGSSVMSAGTINARTWLLTNAGRVDAQRGISFTGAQVDNRGTLASDASVRIDDSLNNTGGIVFARDLYVDGNLNNKMGYVDLSGALYVGRNTDNTEGRLAVGGNLRVAGRLDNTSGLLAAGGNLIVVDRLDNTSGLLAAGYVYAEEIVNRRGGMEVNGLIRSVRGFDNREGTVKAGLVRGAQLDNTKGVLTSFGEVRAMDIVNLGGELNAKGSIFGFIGITNQSGFLQAGGDINTSGGIHNTGGELTAEGSIVANRTIINQGGFIKAGGDINAVGGIDNLGGKLHTQGSIVANDRLINQSGFIKAGGDLRVRGFLINNETMRWGQGIEAGRLLVDGRTLNFNGMITTRYGFARSPGSVVSNGSRIVNLSNPGDPFGYPIGYPYGYPYGYRYGNPYGYQIDPFWTNGLQVASYGGYDMNGRW
ncbi:filamentous hemagglutinin N-terminal domain-containing protein [Paraherbaspirillum soli]|uniref:Filamentous hemagglutinin N-terminal domain-containing protein n=1 Tax=Paraherbaspirillum soli TaxID=631222 RepID=A0ABW0MBH0_9BURK